MTTDNLIPLAELVADGLGASVPGARRCEDHDLPGDAEDIVASQRTCQRW